ncbi:MAG: hypothetical protein BECKG1743E_GA0114224_113071, partial [Candidatus Kentron sp. G]
MRLLLRLESGQNDCAIRYILFRQSPNAPQISFWLLLDSRLIFYDHGCFAGYLPRRGCVFQPRVA